MSAPDALHRFKTNLDMPRQLIKLEREHFRDPPATKDLVAVKGLRGGVAVLTVASFESFLKDLISEHIDELATRVDSSSFGKLPDQLQVTNTYNSLEEAMRGPRYSTATGRVNRLSNVKRAASFVYNDELNPESFGQSRNNPGKETVREVCREVGLTDIFKRLKERFEKRWGVAVSHSFIPDKLEEIVLRRHRAAHGVPGLNLSRADLREGIKFIRILGEVLDIELRHHFRQIRQRTSSP